MDKIDEIIEVVGFIKDRMATKEDLIPITDRLTAIEGKLNGINTRIDHEAERNFEQDVRLQKLETK